MIFQFGAIPNPVCILRGTNASGCIDDTTNSVAGDAGIIAFGSNIIRLIIIAGGIFALFNFVMAGMAYITSQGDPKGVQQAQQQIFNSIIGLVIMAASFMLAAVVGLLLFGSATVFLAPTLYTVE